MAKRSHYALKSFPLCFIGDKITSVTAMTENVTASTNYGYKPTKWETA